MWDLVVESSYFLFVVSYSYFVSCFVLFSVHYDFLYLWYLVVYYCISFVVPCCFVICDIFWCLISGVLRYLMFCVICPFRKKL